MILLLISIGIECCKNRCGNGFHHIHPTGDQQLVIILENIHEARERPDEVAMSPVNYMPLHLPLSLRFLWADPLWLSGAPCYTNVGSNSPPLCR
jgi:hypothetical protein